VVLGYNSPEQLAGGRLRLRPELAWQVIEQRVATPLRVSAIEAAWGVYAVAAANMMRAVKAVSTYRGRDPREFTLFAFGGNGPLAAPEVARALGMRRVIVPPIPGLFSAFGLLCSHTEYLASRTLFRRLSELDPAELLGALGALEAQVRASLQADGISNGAVSIHRRAELRYAGQAFELGVPLGADLPDPGAIAAAFDAEHERTYGHSSPGAPTDLVSLQALGRALTGVEGEVLRGVASAPSPAASRPAYFGPEFGLRDTPVLSRGALRQVSRPGPLIVDEFDATTVVPPDATCRLDAHGNIEIALGGGPDE
jgi:N-methylhydantoinase A